MIIFYICRIISFTNEQFDRISNALISLLSHADADYRLIAATNLASLKKETKAIDIALLNSFLNDARVYSSLYYILLFLYFYFFRFLFELNVVIH